MLSPFCWDGSLMERQGIEVNMSKIDVDIEEEPYTGFDSQSMNV